MNELCSTWQIPFNPFMDYPLVFSRYIKYTQWYIQVIVRLLLCHKLWPVTVKMMLNCALQHNNCLTGPIVECLVLRIYLLMMREQVIGVKEFIYFIKHRSLVYIYLINMGRLTLIWIGINLTHFMSIWNIPVSNVTFTIGIHVFGYAYPSQWCLSRPRVR